MDGPRTWPMVNPLQNRELGRFKKLRVWLVDRLCTKCRFPNQTLRCHTTPRDATQICITRASNFCGGDRHRKVRCWEDIIGRCGYCASICEDASLRDGDQFVVCDARSGTLV